MHFTGVIFDFNGVLLWDAHLHFEAWQESAVLLRGKALTEGEFRLHVHGRTNSSILTYLVGPIDREEEARLVQVKESAYRALCLSRAADFVLSPGAPELLDHLAERGTPMTIATASEASNVDFFFQHLKLGRWFERDRVTYDNDLLAGKPAPDIYLAAARCLGLHPGLCIVVEDAVSGLAAAYAAGIGYIIALGPHEEHQRLKAYAGVNQVIEDLRAFPKRALREPRASLGA